MKIQITLEQLQEMAAEAARFEWGPRKEKAFEVPGPKRTPLLELDVEAVEERKVVFVHGVRRPDGTWAPAVFTPTVDVVLTGAPPELPVDLMGELSMAGFVAGNPTGPGGERGAAFAKWVEEYLAWRLAKAERTGK